MRTRRLHILHLMNVSDIGGAERVMLTLAKTLDPQEFSMCVACLRGGGRLAAETRRIGLAFYSLSLKNPPAFAAAFFRLVKREKIDIVQTYGAQAEFIGAVMARLGGVRAVISSLHDLYSLENRGKRLINRIADSLIDRYVAVCRIVGEQAGRRLGLVATRLCVIENGIEAAAPQRTREATALRLKLGVGAEQRLLVTVANLRPVKGHVYILHAVALMTREERDSLKFCFVGADLSSGEVQRLAVELGVADAIIFAGFQAEISLYLQAADAFLLASESEGSSLSVLEALAAGCPVIAANVGGPAEMIEDHVNGLLIARKSPAAIKVAVLELLSQPVLREKLRANGRQTWARRFSAARMADDYASLYREVYEKSGRT